MAKKYRFVMVKAANVVQDYRGISDNDYVFNIPYKYKYHGREGCERFLDRLEERMNQSEDSPLVPLNGNATRTSEGFGSLAGHFFFSFEDEQENIPECMKFVEKCADAVLQEDY